MKDQKTLDETETQQEKWDRAKTLLLESLYKPDSALRSCAYNQGCYEDLMQIREHVLEYLKTLKEVTHHTYADESDELETAKLIEVKDRIAVESKPFTKWR